MIKFMSKRSIMAGAFSALMAVGSLSVANAQNASQLTPAQQQAFEAAKARANDEIDRFNKMSPAEKKAYMEQAQKQAEEQLNSVAKNLNPEQRKALEEAKVKAKAEMERFSKMSPEEQKAYMEAAQKRVQQQLQNLTPEQRATMQRGMQQLEQKAKAAGQ